MVLASTLLPMVLVQSLVIKMFQQTMLMLSRMPSFKDQSLLLLKPIKPLSNNTHLVLFPLAVDKISITVFLLLDTVQRTDKTSSLSRINGVHLGEIMVTSKLPLLLPTFVVSFPTHPMLPYEDDGEFIKLYFS